jgi:Zn-dependent M28 family amino/carboxypeptidase
MEYKNVIASFGIANARRIIVGAHYDVCGNQQGADDNASGVTGLLELARLLSHQPLKKRIDLVAYTLEEPPYFRTEQMGSYVHAKSLLDIKDQVEGMVCLEMIGCFKDQEDSQQYPVDALKAMYGTKGDFITLVQKSANSPFAKQFARQYKNTGVIKTEEFVGPVTMPGIDFSDHFNYWNFGFGALMITDTSFYRNKNYHQPGDTIDKLDLNRMSKVIDGVYLTLTAF